MVKKIEKRQKDILEDLKDHSAGDKAFVIGASYLLDVCSRALELFEAESTKVEQKRYLIDFILSNATLDGEKLQFNLKEPFEAIIALSKTGKWYTRRDLNSRPIGPQPIALSTELRGQNFSHLIANHFTTTYENCKIFVVAEICGGEGGI